MKPYSMRRIRAVVAAFGVALLGAAGTTGGWASTADQQDLDPYLWLEEVQGERALTWVREQNAKSRKLLEASPHFLPIRDKLLEIFNSKARIPLVQKRGAWLYNFWQDETNVRGLWRRTTIDEFKKAAPKWEPVLNLDQLAKAENENWVWRGANCRYPKYERCLVTLSRGGADAAVVREVDAVAKAFVRGGFELKESKGGASWSGDDSLFVHTDFGERSLTRSGYPRIVKEWRRGTPLASARTIFVGEESDVSASAFSVEQQGYATRQFVRRSVTFHTNELYLRDGTTLTKLDLPADASASVARDMLWVRLRSAWSVGGKSWPSGALIAMDFARFMKGDRDFMAFFEPSDRTSLTGWTVTKNALIVNELNNVRNRVSEWVQTDGQWARRPIDMPGLGTIAVSAVDPDESDEYFLTFTDFLTPSTLMLGKAGDDRREVLKSLPAFFDATPYTVEQLEALSKDGERIPYFVVMSKRAKRDGKNPTLLYGYGGFEVSQLPGYSGTVGSAWLAHGGVYVVANIRGGGEFGPRWHQAGLKQNRQRVFDDFIAVAEDLIKRNITSPRHLAIAGGSNGGLLVGAVMVQRPELFRAVVCSVPLLDMKRYHKLLAGASWMAEYGNPDDPKEWEFIGRYSPYQNIKADVRYPRTLFITSTRDDRVHPAHARKMMARMAEQGHAALYYENIEGGHAASANQAQLAYRNALQYAFLLEELR
jgi:prolyl oligopeptidase